VTQYVSALELATYLNGTTDLDDLTPEWVAQANLLLEMISADVEAAAGIPIEAGSGEVILAGTWSRDLLLPGGPTRSVAAVTVNGLTLDASTYVWNERGLIRRGADSLTLDAEDSNEGWELVREQGARYRSGQHWGGPASTVIVSRSHGFDDVPDIVRSLVLRIAGRTFGNVAQVTQESLAIYSVSYGQSSNVNDGSHVTRDERLRLRRALNRTGGTILTGGR